MRVQDLIEMLEDMDPEAHVRLAFQPEWPLEHRIEKAIEVDGKVYISDGGQIGYLPTKVAVKLEWSEEEELEEVGEEELDAEEE